MAFYGWVLGQYCGAIVAEMRMFFVDISPSWPEDSPSLHWPDSAYDGREVVMVRFSSETERESDGLFTMMGAPSLSVDWGVAVAAALVTGL